MTTTLDRTTAVQVEGTNEIELAQRDDRFKTPMIPGAREAGMLTTFGRPVVILEQSAVTMDAATIAAHQREGGGAPSERRRPRDRSRWQNVKQALRLLVGVDQR